MGLYNVKVQRHDEIGKQDAQVLVEADDIESARELGLEFARGHVFFGADPRWVNWSETSPVVVPYVLRVDSRTPPPKKRTRRRTADTEAKS